MQNKRKWYKNRNYLHFDLAVSFDNASKVVTDSEAVKKHSFYPLIKFEISTVKLKKEKGSSTLYLKPKDRPISYAAHMDAHIYSYYAYILYDLYESNLVELKLSDNILAFRSLGKSNIEFANEAFETIKTFGECNVIALDVSKFFDTLDHEILKYQWSSILGDYKLPEDHYQVFKSLTKFSFVYKDQIYSEFGISKNKPKKGRRRICMPSEFRNRVRSKGLINPNIYSYGIPQGTPISALLSNIYMLEFDSKIKIEMDKINAVYRRYCDDMLFILPPSEDEKLFAAKVNALLKEYKLKINIAKTEIRKFSRKGMKLKSDQPLQYLGFTFNGEKIRIRSAAFARYSERMNRGVKLAKSTMIKKNSIRREKGLPSVDLYKRKLYARYSHLGKSNFITYGYRAAKIMNSIEIKRQLKPLWKRLQDKM